MLWFELYRLDKKRLMANKTNDKITIYLCTCHTSYNKLLSVKYYDKQYKLYNVIISYITSNMNF